MLIRMSHKIGRKVFPLHDAVSLKKEEKKEKEKDNQYKLKEAMALERG